MAVEDRFGPFRILSRLGRGGMGETFVAERVGPAGFAQRVCLKRILTTDGADASWTAMFQREARLVALLHHPNIVKLFDFGQERGKWWMSLELVEGVDLRQILTASRESSTRLPIEAVAFIAAELVKALAHAHARRLPDGTPAGIVHRDVSPANVLISFDGCVLLTDFGIAKWTHAERTRTGQMKGKAPYISPEHAMGDPVDGRADLFALGVVMFELLAGVRPYDGPTDLATQINAVEGKRRDLRELAPATPDALVRIVERLIESRVDRRFGSAWEVLDALSEIAVPANVVWALGKAVRDAAAGGPPGELTDVDERTRRR